MDVLPRLGATRASCFAAVVLMTGQTAAATNPVEPADGEALDLLTVSAVRQAQSGYRPVTPKAIEDARRRLQQATARWKDYLHGQGERGSHWRVYLQCDALEEQLQREAPDLQILEAILTRYAADHCGLELLQCCDVRRALRDYIRLLHDALDEGLAEEYSGRLDTLLVPAHDPRLDEAARRESLGSQLAWFLAHNQADALTREVRRRYSSPNLVLSISNDFVSRAVAQEIDERMPIQQVQGQTAIRGSARLRGSVQAVFVDNPMRAEIDVIFRGDLRATMTGSRGPVTVAARGNARVACSKRLWLTERGLGAHSARSDVALQTHLRGVATQFCRPILDRAVSRLALGLAEREKGEADARASAEARRLMSARFDEEVVKLAGGVQRRYLEAFRNPLLRRDAFPEHFALRTTRGQLRLSVLQSTSIQLGAPRAAPQVAESGDVSLALHETFVNNFAETMFGGRTMTESDLRDQWRRLTGSPPDADAPGTSDADEVAITFPERSPLTLRIADGVVAVTLRGAHYISKSRAYPPMNVTVRYRLQQVGDGYLAEMAGDPEIIPPRFLEEDGLHRYSGREAALRRLLVNRLDKHLKKRMESERLMLPRSVGDARELLVRQLEAHDGWLTAAFALAPSPVETVFNDGEASSDGTLISTNPH